MINSTSDPNKITIAETWPPGSIIIYNSPGHTGLGLVVANDKQNILVIWDAASNKMCCEYRVDYLNPQCIFPLSVFLAMKNAPPEYENAPPS